MIQKGRFDILSKNGSYESENGSESPMLVLKHIKNYN